MSKISYDLSKIKAIVFDVDGVLATSTIPLGDNGVPRRTVNTKDGFAMQLAVKRGLRLAIITGAVSPGITERFEGLGITEIFTGVGMKLPVFKEWIERNGLTPEEVVYVGDDIPDYECMRYAGLAVAPSDAAVDVLEIAGYISPVTGGHGVARDILEEVMRAQGIWALSDRAFGW
ncbi:MAG: HAD hydrolase-like protein [Muribaculaceae bacterium]|nr:HAD hydrolase-like protein [Muribaculaceae bacterium]